MKITLDKINIQGVLLGRENPLPMFRDRERTKPCSFDETFDEEDKKLFGYDTGFQVLPYQMQDSYSREKKNIELKTIVLENENLKAVFLAEYGGRLMSLVEKKTGRDLLFCNDVFQPANLSTRNAWFSGGIEWNMGQFGHSVLTCEPLFFARMENDRGEDFLRMYEYERNRRVFYSIDFHLPSGAEQLSAYVRIVNDKDESVPMYWWTNIALREEKDIRIFSDTDEVIYIKPESNISEGDTHQFGKASIKTLPSLPEKDASKPMNFDFSSEYFFQNPKTSSSPWEAAVYNDGFTFYERSTPLLQYRKMFCWGTHKGGRNWCDFLSTPSKGDYLEIQAGLAPTQLHGLIMPGNTTWDFTQIFGAADISYDRSNKDWDSSRAYIKEWLDNKLSTDEVRSRHKTFQSFGENKPVEILHIGSGWGALEGKRREITEHSKPMPEGFSFPVTSMGPKQKFWLDLLNDEKMDDSIEKVNKLSWMVDPDWQGFLEKCVKNEKNNPWPLIHLGILLFENGKSEKAVECWQESISIKATAMAWRNLSKALKEWGDKDQSIDALKRAAAIINSDADAYIVKELVEMLTINKRFDEAWKYYSSLPAELAKDERLTMYAAKAAFHKNDSDYLDKFFKQTFAGIREGETFLVDLWYRYQTKKVADQRGMSINDDLKKEVIKNYPPPKTIDFTMSERDKK